MTRKVIKSEEQYFESVQVKSEDEDSNDDVLSEVSSNKESDVSDNEEQSTANVPLNAGWADSIGKILRTNKPKGKKTLVLSKAKKITDIHREKPIDPGFQIDGEIKKEKPDPLLIFDQIKREAEEPLRKKRKDIISVRVKPNVLDKDKERTLSKIATRGVVQLFNAVRMQQKDIENKLEDAGPLERKRDKVIKNIDKRQFLNVLMGEKSELVDGPVKHETTKQENDKSDKSSTSWNVLRDDFMMGAKLKDWDKEMEDDNDGSPIDEEFSDSS